NRVTRYRSRRTGCASPLTTTCAFEVGKFSAHCPCLAPIVGQGSRDVPAGGQSARVSEDEALGTCRTQKIIGSEAQQALETQSKLAVLRLGGLRGRGGAQL